MKSKRRYSQNKRADLKAYAACQEKLLHVQQQMCLRDNSERRHAVSLKLLLEQMFC